MNFDSEQFVSVVPEDSGLTLILKLENACVFYRMTPETGDALIQGLVDAQTALKKEADLPDLPKEGEDIEE